MTPRVTTASSARPSATTVDLVLKVVTVSMETQKIVSKLPRLEF